MAKDEKKGGRAPEKVTPTSIYKKNLSKYEASVRAGIESMARLHAARRLRLGQALGANDAQLNSCREEVAEGLYKIFVEMKSAVHPPGGHGLKILTRKDFVDATSSYFEGVREEIGELKNANEDVPENPPITNGGQWQRRAKYDFYDGYIRQILNNLSDPELLGDFYDNALIRDPQQPQAFQAFYRPTEGPRFIPATYIRKVFKKPESRKKPATSSGGGSAHCNGWNHKPGCQCGWGGPRGGKGSQKVPAPGVTLA